MAATRMNASRTLSLVRIAAVACAAGLGVSGVWIAGCELLAPNLGYFPTQAEVARWTEQRGWASAAAKIGHVRGDLWTLASVTQMTAVDQPAAADPRGQVRDIAISAARHAPHDSRAWLMLARLDVGGGAQAGVGAEMLKLSYYTGSGELSLAPLRLAVAARTAGIAEPELQGLLELEIQRVLLRRPDLKSALGDAYRGGTPQGREVFASVLKQADPALLASLQAER